MLKHESAVEVIRSQKKGLGLGSLCLATMLSLTACAGYQSGPSSPSESATVLQGLQAAGYTYPKFTITNPRHEFKHTEVHVDIAIQGCESSFDVPVEPLTGAQGVEYEPVTGGSIYFSSAAFITPEQFLREHHC